MKKRFRNMLSLALSLLLFLTAVPFSGLMVTVFAACSHSETTFINNGNGTHSEICSLCSSTLSTAPHRMGRNKQTNANGHLTECSDCKVGFTYAHDDKGSVTTISGTCVTPGQIKYRCSVMSCPYFGRTEETGLNAANHEGPYTYQEAVAATCSSSGNTRGQFCTACNQWKVAPQTTDPDLTNHVNTEPVTETFSTCVKHGYTAGVYCNDCETWISGHEEKPLADHVWSETGTITKAATCVAMGETTYACAVAGCTATDVRTDVEIDPTNHVNTEEFPETASYCYKSGYTAGVYCNDCEQWISGHEEKTRPEHSWQEIEKVKATCSGEGYIDYACSVKSCGATKHVVLERDPDAHDLRTTMVPPTCTDEGYTSHACTLCRYGYNDEIVPALGHRWNAPEWKWNGTKAEATFICANGDHPETVTATVTSETAKEPTDTEAGATRYTATVEFDGKTYTDTMEQSIPALNEGLCKWCGERHDGSIWQKIVGFFHSIAYFFAHLFGKR